MCVYGGKGNGLDDKPLNQSEMQIKKTKQQSHNPFELSVRFTAYSPQIHIDRYRYACSSVLCVKLCDKGATLLIMLF